MTKGSLRLDRDINHQIRQNSLVAMTQKVSRVLGHQTHILSTLGRIGHIYISYDMFKLYSLQRWRKYDSLTFNIVIIFAKIDAVMTLYNIL